MCLVFYRVEENWTINQIIILQFQFFIPFFFLYILRNIIDKPWVIAVDVNEKGKIKLIDPRLIADGLY